MPRPRLLLVPSFTELEWSIRPALEEWAEVASFDTPGVGDEELAFDFELDPRRTRALLYQWREAAAERGLAEVDRHGWTDFFVVSHASRTIVSTDDGFEDIVAAFPEARTVIGPEACTPSPAFADALRHFCEESVPSARR